MDGLLQNIPHLRMIHDRAWVLCGNSFFQPVRLRELLERDVRAQDQSLHLHIEARIALATWVCSVLGEVDHNIPPSLSPKR